MKAFLRQRPWVIIVAVKVLFVSWWIGFILWASQHTPQQIETPPRSGHASH
jgi:hypothetical protein